MVIFQPKKQESKSYICTVIQYSTPVYVNLVFYKVYHRLKACENYVYISACVVSESGVVPKNVNLTSLWSDVSGQTAFLAASS